MPRVDRYKAFTQEEVEQIKQWFQQHSVQLDTEFVSENHGLMDSGTLVDFDLIDRTSDVDQPSVHCDKCGSEIPNTEQYGITDVEGFHMILKISNGYRYYTNYADNQFTDHSTLTEALQQYKL
jgi:hypothetical protein